MNNTRVELLEQRVRELEQELSEREGDLAVFRGELTAANHKLEAFLSHMARELKVLAQIQKILVPTELGHIPGFEFSSKFVAGLSIGGDYFDIFEHEDKLRFGVIISHASGYSASALLLSILLKMTGQMEARRGTAPEAVLETLIREMQPSLNPSDEAHIFYGMIDRRSFDLVYASVGFNIGLCYLADTGKLERLENTDIPLTANSSITVAQHTLSLNPRDRLVLCSEGLLKVTNESGELFGEERLYRVVLSAGRLGVHELRNEILYQAQQFSGTAEFNQDVTVVVLEVKNRVIKLAKT